MTPRQRVQATHTTAQLWRCRRQASTLAPTAPPDVREALAHYLRIRSRGDPVLLAHVDNTLRLFADLSAGTPTAGAGTSPPSVPVWQ